ncbi:MAG: hypothetical protein RJQ00_06005 [Vicingaceae bacterium]
MKDWLNKTFVIKYIIIRNEMVQWHLYTRNRRSIRYALAQSELLSEVNLLSEFKFSRAIKKAYAARGIWSFLLLKILIRWYGVKYKYRRIKEDDAVFVTDLTGLTSN